MKIEEELYQAPFKNEIQKVTLNILFTSNWIVHSQKAFFKPYGITIQQYNVLKILHEMFPKAISTSQIKEQMPDRHSDASRIVERLEAKGWVKKSVCDDDRRLVDVSISQYGITLLKEMDAYIDEFYHRLVNLSDTEAVTLNRLLDKLRSA